MNIADFIQTELLLPRLKRRGVLVVYDPDRRYRELCLALGTEELAVVDASESSIDSRETAMRALGALGRSDGGPRELLIYVPARTPDSDEERQHDPFALYTACGGTFPEGDGDEYLSVCLKAKPDHTTEIRRIFEESPNPPFTVIDKVGGGLGWPTLRALLGAESARDILYALLVPGDRQQRALKDDEIWVSEARDLLLATLDLSLKTRGKTWSSIADRLWRFLLYSEFVFDLPQEVPASLADVPHAKDAARPLVEDLCDRLRRDQKACATYIERAEMIEQELDLPARCAAIEDLGVCDTFPFEERTFLTRAVQGLRQDKLDGVRDLLDRHAGSVWGGKGESQAQWGLVEAALHLVEVCGDQERQIGDRARSQEQLIDHYLGSLREADRRQREFEQAAGDCLLVDAMEGIVEQARASYRRLAEKVQRLFTRHLETTGWPPPGRLSNADVFDRLVAPLLQENGRRAAYILVDALRYELGVALQQQLAEDDPAELQAAFAQLPSVTPVGMASLLPGAGKDLHLARKNDGFVPMLGDAVVANVAQRMEVLRRRYGDRFDEMLLNDFVRFKRKPADSVNLFVLRSVDIDSHLEKNADTALSLTHETLKRLRAAIHRLKTAGFHHVVIATDHGFFLNAQAEAGDVCAKPAGTWINVHERSLLGAGKEDAHNFVLPAEKVGIRGEFDQIAGPRSMAPYRKGLLYLHGGASLQEAVVPVLTIQLQQKQPEPARATVTLSYKNGAKRITTRLPVVDVLLEADMFSQGEDFEILLEAQNRKGEVVGEAKAGGPVDPATGTVTLKPRERVQVTMRMQLEFEGKFTVKALDPTTLAAYCSLELETDYTV